MIFLLLFVSRSWAWEANPATSREFFPKQLPKFNPVLQHASDFDDGDELFRFAPSTTCGDGKRTFVSFECTHSVDLRDYRTSRRGVRSNDDYTPLAVDGLSVGLKAVFSAATIKRFEIELLKGHF